MSSWFSAVFAAVFGNIQLTLPFTVSQARWHPISFGEEEMGMGGWGGGGH